MRRCVYILMWVFIFSIPWKNAVIFSDSLTITKLFGVGTIGFAVLVVLLQQRVRRLRPFHYAFGFYLAWVMVSYLWSVDKGATVRQITTFVQLAGMIWLIWEFARERVQQLGLLRAYIWGAYVAVFSTLMRYFSGTASVKLRYGTAGFNPNDVGGLLVLGLPIAWYLASKTKSEVWRWFYQLYIGLALPAILLTGSRSALLAAAVALLIVPFSYVRIRLSRKIATAVVMLVAAYGLVAYVPADTWERLYTIDTEIASGSFGQRGIIWKAGLDVFPQRPIAGVGAGGYNQTMIPYFQRTISAHNVYLNILVEGGLIGACIFACMVALVTAPVRKMSGLERTFWLVLLMTLAVVLIPRNWEYRKPIWLILGLLCAWNATDAQERTRKHSAPPAEKQEAPTRIAHR